MTIDSEYFDFGLWWGKIITSSYGLQHLILYLNDKDSILTHLKKNNSVKSLDNESGGLINSDSATIDRFATDLHSEFENAGSMYLNNMIVFQYVILEQILEQSVFLFLISNNNLLKRVEQINSEFRINSSFDLDTLTSAELTKDIIKSVCKRASTYVISGKIDKSLNRIEKLIGLKYSTKIVRFLQDLQNKRNAIVHESRFKTVEIEYFYEIVDFFQDVLIGLEKEFDKKKIKYERPFNWNRIT